MLRTLLLAVAFAPAALTACGSDDTSPKESAVQACDRWVAIAEDDPLPPAQAKAALRSAYDFAVAAAEGDEDFGPLKRALGTLAGAGPNTPKATIEGATLTAFDACSKVTGTEPR